MSFQIKFSNQASKFIRNLQQTIRERIKEKLKDVA